MLDNFRAISVTWDHSTNTIYNNIRTASEDANGRKLVVQVVNGHQLEDLTSVDLRLYWEFDEHKGFDDFELIDEDNGIYEIHFSTDMVSHVGAHKAWLHLVDAEGTVTSEPFTVTVFEGVDADTIQDSNEFSALSNALVAISDLETNYAPRLNSVENNKADKATVNSEVSRLDQKDADLTAQLAQTDIEARRLRGLNDLDEETLSFIHDGTGGPITLEGTPKNKSVTHNKTTFSKDSGGKNLFEGEYLSGYLSGQEPFALRAIDESTVGKPKYTVVKVNPFEKIYISKSNDTGGIFCATFEEYPKHGDVPHEYFGLNIGANDLIINTGEGSEYLVVVPMLTSDENPPLRLQITKNEAIPPFEETYISLSNKSLENFTKKSETNLFDGEYKLGHLVGYSPFLFSVENSDALHTVTPVKAGDDIHISKSNDTGGIFCATFEEYPKHGDVPHEYFGLNIGANELSIKIGEGAKYLVTVPMRLADENPPEWLQIEKGDGVTPYKEPYVIDDRFIEFPESTVNKISNSKYVIETHYGSSYTPVTELGVPFNGLNLDVVYDHYDSLTNDFSDYVFKETIGYESTGLPINRYDFIPKRTGRFNDDLPKVFVLSGVHGQEKWAMSAVMRFFNDLARNWTDSKMLQALRFNVHFILLPAVNPYGVKNSYRYNANGVNLNRNSRHNWVHNENQYDSSGPSPLSEVETQIVYDIFENESNILYVMDTHNYVPFNNDTGSSGSGSSTIWTASNSREGNKLLSGWARDMLGSFFTFHPEYASKNESRIHVDDNYRSTANGWLSLGGVEFDIPGVMIEMSPDAHINDFHTHAVAKMNSYIVKAFTER